MLTKYDIAAIIGCYMNGCTIDQIYSIFDGLYYKYEITDIIDDFIKKTGWEGKNIEQYKNFYKEHKRTNTL